jgi:hypothetical protein
MKPPALPAGAALLLAAALAGCRQPGPPAASEGDAADGPAWFADVTTETGLDFVHDAGPTGAYFMPQIMGSGAALFDFDGDGLLDVYLLQNGGPDSPSKNRLYRQLPGGRFRAVDGSGLEIAGYNMGVAVGDVNNDGRPDVLVTQYGGNARLFLNEGDGTFTEATREAGLENPQWGTSACFVDYDRDGWLDLVVVNYLDYDRSQRCTGTAGTADFCAPQAFPGTLTRLFHNRGPVPPPPGGPAPGRRATPVRFEDVSLASGVGRVAGPGLGVVAADFNGDGWPDLFVANDGKPNRLWVNRKDGTFADEAVRRNVAFNEMGRTEANMGIALGDVDGDGLFDLVVTHLTRETHTLWRQGPRGSFRDRTASAGLSRPCWRGTGFGTALGDFDQDGFPDLAVVNGGVFRGARADNPELDPFWRDYAERNQLFANDGSGKFRDVSPQNRAFCGTPRVSRGLAVGDLFNDGSLHLLVTQVAGPARVYRNVAPGRGHWLEVRALDPALKRDAYGAEVHVDAGGRRRAGLVSTAGSFLCSNDPRVHFGLGAADRVEAVRVVWPDGTEETFPGGPADRQVVLRKGEGRPAGR